MTKRAPKKQVDAAWQQMRDALGGEVGKSLDFAREWVGDTDFILLAQDYGAAEVIISCGIQSAAENLELKLRRDIAPRDVELQDAVAAAHAARTR